MAKMQTIGYSQILFLGLSVLLREHAVLLRESGCMKNNKKLNKYERHLRP